MLTVILSCMGNKTVVDGNKIPRKVMCVTSEETKVLETGSPLNRFGRRINDTSFEGIMWLLNAMPKLLGSYVLGDKINVYYWTFHLTMVFYIYVAGILIYQIKIMDNLLDFVKNYVNILLTAMMLNLSYWFLTKRESLKVLCQMVKINDELVSDSKANPAKHLKFLKRIKYIMMACIAFNFIDDFIYQIVSRRIDPNNDYGIVNCPGLDTRTRAFDKHLCRALLLLHESNLYFFMTYYHLFYLFLVSHTAAMYDLLAKELIDLKLGDNKADVPASCDGLRNKVHTIIKRHGLIVQTCTKLKNLYSTPIGVDFIVNASSICVVSFVHIEDLHLVAFVIIYSTGFLFVFCYLGQRLTTAAENFERAVYISDWANFRPREQRKIFVMLMQAQVPVVLVAADIVPVKIYTFAQTIQAVYKLFTVVKF